MISNVNMNACLEDLIRTISTQEYSDSSPVQSVLDNIEALALEAGELDKHGFQDVCLLVQEKISDIADTQGQLNTDQYSLLNQWHVLASSYLKKSDEDTATALLDFCFNSGLFGDMEESDLIIVKNMLGEEYAIENDPDLIQNLDTSSKPEPAIETHTIEHIIEVAKSNRHLGLLYASLLFQRYIQAINPDTDTLNDELEKRLNEWIALSTEYLSGDNKEQIALKLADILHTDGAVIRSNSNDAQTLIELFEFKDDLDINSALSTPYKELLGTFYLYADSPELALLSTSEWVEQLGLAAGKLNLLGFQDCCLIVSEYITDVVNTETTRHIDYILLIAEFLLLARKYLMDPENKQTSDALFEYLTNEHWPKAIAREDLIVLQEIMLQEANKEITTSHLTSTNAVEEEPQKKSELYEEIDTSDTLATPHAISRELVEMLHEEMLLIKQEAAEPFKTIDSKTWDTSKVVPLLEQYALRIERFGGACQAAEMDGLYQASTIFLKNLHHLSSCPDSITTCLQGLLLDWPDSVLFYLNAPDESTSSDQILQILQHENLPEKLINSVAPALTNLLQAALISDDLPVQESLQKSITLDDISISLPADINQPLLDGLMFELPGQMESLSASIQSLVNGSGGLEDIQQAQRIAHTIKGAANTVGVKGIATLTHELEDILSALIKFNCLAPQQLALSMIEAADCLEEMSESLSVQGSAPDNSLDVLEQLVNWSNRITAEGSECLKSGAEVQENKVSDSNMDQVIPEKANETSTYNEKDAMIQVPVSLIDNALRLLGESKIITSQLQERLKQSELRSQSLIQHQNIVQNLVSDLEIQVDVNSGVTHRNIQHDHSNAFDTLEFEEYNELHTVTNRIVEASVDSHEFNKQLADGFSDIDELLVEKSRLHQEIQELIMRSRMIPVSKIVPRLQRIVRQTGRTTNKPVKLAITGAETLIDSDVLDKLIDPLMHILRNAVDHGIESGELRQSKNKPEQGQITLDFVQEGNLVHIRCQDDGAGLSRKEILEKAVNSGFIEQDEDIDNTRLFRVILNPGFTTRKNVTQTSGRGVGMDVVNTQIQLIKGTVHIESEQDQGCLIQIKVPVTLGTTHAILVRSVDRIIAVSNHAVERILHPGDFSTEETEDGFMANFNGEHLPMLTLEHLLHLPAERRNTDRELRPALLLEGNELNYIVTVQEIVDTRDLYVKTMGDYLTDVRGVPGATILGDGSVVPVVDLPELIRSPSSRMDMTAELTKTDIINSLPIALVVDDSLSARRALAQVVQDAGFDVRTAKDGLEAIEIIDKCKPDILLVDMEMPRMNGVELTSHVRGSKEIKDLPVIMITSRTTDKHKQTATTAGVNVYLTKPFSEDNLLDHVHALLN